MPLGLRRLTRFNPITSLGRQLGGGLLAIVGVPAQAQVGSPYAWGPVARGGRAPYAFTLTGSLPFGWSFSSSTGAVAAASPAQAATISGLTITVTDAAGATASLAGLQILVVAAGQALTAETGVTVRGDYAEGETLTADWPGIVGGDEVQEPQFSWQWFRDIDGVERDWPGATDWWFRVPSGFAGGPKPRPRVTVVRGTETMVLRGAVVSGVVAAQPFVVTRFLARAASGTGDGLSAANAAAITSAALNSAVAAIAGGTEAVGIISDGAPITVPRLTLSNGGSAGAPKRIVGLNPDGTLGEVELASTRTELVLPADPDVVTYLDTAAPRGEYIFQANAGASYLTFQGIKASRALALVRIGGAVSNIKIEACRGNNVARIFDNDSTFSVSDIAIRGLDVDGFSKSCLRFRNGDTRLLIDGTRLNSHKIARDRSGSTYTWAAGISISGAVSEVDVWNTEVTNIFDDLGGINPPGGTYPNGDGIDADEGTKALRVRHYRGNRISDAAMDLKCDAQVEYAWIRDCKRNGRFWGDGGGQLLRRIWSGPHAPDGTYGTAQHCHIGSYHQGDLKIDGLVTVGGTTRYQLEGNSAIRVKADRAIGGATDSVQAGSRLIPFDPADTTAPVFATSAVQTVAENAVFTLPIAVTVPTADLAYAIIGGADRSKFTIDATTGILTLPAKDYDANLDDADLDHVYEVQVRVRDAGWNDANLLIYVSVTNVFDPVADIGPSAAVVRGDAPENTLIATFTNLDSGETITGFSPASSEIKLNPAGTALLKGPTASAGKTVNYTFTSSAGRTPVLPLTTTLNPVIPTSARQNTHVAPIRALGTTDYAVSIASPTDGTFAIGSGGKALFVGATAPAAGTRTVVLNVEHRDPLTDAVTATRTETMSVDVLPALTEMVWWYAPTAQGTGDGSSTANAAVLSQSSLSTNVNAANAAGRPADHLLRADLGTYARSTSTFTLSVGGTSEMTRQRIRGVDAAGATMKVPMTGARVAAPTTNQTLQYLFLLTNDASFITFSDFALTNVSCFCNARGRDTSLGIHSAHRELEFKNFDVNNCYRLILLMPDPGSSTWPEFIQANEGIRIWDINADYVGHSIGKGFNFCRLDARRVTANHRGISQTNNYPATFDLSSSFGSTKADVATRLYFEEIACLDNVDYQATYSQGDGLQLDSSNTGIGGEMAYIEADGTTIPDYVIIRNCSGRGTADGAVDAKVSGVLVDGLEAINCKRGYRDWNKNQALPSRIRNLRVYNTRVPATPGTDDAPCCYLAAISNTGSVLIDALFYQRAAGTVVPDGSGRSMLGATIWPSATKASIILGDTSRTNQKVDIRGWSKFNLDVLSDVLDRGGSTGIEGFVGTIDPAMPTPAPSVSWRSGFAAGFVPQGTPVGTVLADIGGAAGASVAGLILEAVLNTDADDKFEIVGDSNAGYRLRLKNALSYAIKGSHAITIRATPGIVGTEAWRDPANNLTWQCWLGPYYADLSVTIAVTGTEEAETASFFTGTGLTSPTARRRAAINAYIRDLKDAKTADGAISGWAAADILPLGVAGWDLASSVRDLKLFAHGTVAGTMTFESGLGWTSDSQSGSQITFARPLTGTGQNYTRDANSTVVDVTSDFTSATRLVAGGGGNTTLTPRKSATQGEGRSTGQAAKNITLPTVNGVAGGTGAPLGTWGMHRNTSTSSVVNLNGVQRLAYSDASTSMTTNTNVIFGGVNMTRGTVVLSGNLPDDTLRTAVRLAYGKLKTLLAQGA